MRRLAATLACRAGGSRLYGKPLQFLDVAERLTVLEYMVQFLRTQPFLDDIVLGVAEGPENEPFHRIARRNGLRSIRGDETDVLMRLIQCGQAADATDILRLTTECPFTYFEPLHDAWRDHCEYGNDMTTIDGLPEGTGFEIITMNALRRSHDLGDERHRSELCSLYIREHREAFRIQVLEPPLSVQRLDLRLTIDYPEDLVLCRQVYEHLRLLAPRIPLVDIIEFLDARPDLKELVRPYVIAKRVYA